MTQTTVRAGSPDEEQLDTDLDAAPVRTDEERGTSSTGDGDGLDAIDDTLRQAEEATADTGVDNGDGERAGGEKDPMEARLRLLLPGHTWWSTTQNLPDGLRQIADALGAEVPEDVAPRSHKALFSHPDGLWAVDFMRHDACSNYYVKVQELGARDNGTKVVQKDISVDNTVYLLQMLGVVAR